MGGVLSLMWLRRRALPGAIAGAVAVLVFALFAALGLPINTRYAFLTAAILCVFCGRRRVRLGQPRSGRSAPARGGSRAPSCWCSRCSPTRRRSTARRIANWTNSRASSRIEGDLLALVDDHAINLRCGPVGVPNHAPIPLLALVSAARARATSSARRSGNDHQRRVRRSGQPRRRNRLRARSARSRRAVSVPRGFTETRANRSWLIFQPLRLRWTVHPASRSRAPGACHRPRLRSGSSRCACR